MKEIMQGAGFTDVSWRNFSMGIACLHIGTRPAS
jgi:ubiquinone/menaquinone biosynthesis C-methylase UbiE